MNFWRAVLGRKLILVAILVATGAAVAWVRAGPSREAWATDTERPFETAAENLEQPLSLRMQSPVGGVRVVPATDAPLGVGIGAEAWFIAAGAGVDTVDVFRLPLRISAAGVPVVLGRAVAERPTPDGDERLLDARPGRALVAVSGPGGVHTVGIRGEVLADVLLDAPVRAAVGGLTAHGWWMQLEDIRVTVDLRARRVSPAEGHRLVLQGAVPEPARPGPVVSFAPGPPTAPAGLGLPPERLVGQPEWAAIELADGSHCFSTRTVEGVHLFAFDTRAHRLRWSAGTAWPPTQTGRPGVGERRGEGAAVVRFDGVDGRSGAVDAGQVLVRPVRLAATVTIGPEGGARFGPWDLESLPKGIDVRQAPRPLILDGRSVARIDRLWVGRDRAQTRSALGATADGGLVFAWGPGVTAIGIADALLRAGVRYAVPLRASGAAGVALRTSTGWRPGATGMRPEALSPPRAVDAFVLMPDDGLASGPAAPGAGWRPAGGDHRVRLATRTWPGRVPVRLALIDADAVRLVVQPGLAEPWTGGEPREATPPVEAQFVLTSGVRGARAPFGLKVGDQVWRALRARAMTLAIEPDGGVRIGRWGRELVQSDPWSAVIQGPALLVDGDDRIEPTTPHDLTVTALGVRADGRLVFAAAPDGAVDELVAALRGVGVVSALRLADTGAVDAGQVRAVRAGRGQDVFTGAPTPIEPAGTALAIVAVPPPPAVQVVSAVRD